MRKASFVVSAAILVAGLMPMRLDAQITITSSDVMQPVGTQFGEETTEFGSYAVDLGQTGGPQSWDFTSYSTPYHNDFEVVDRNDTPFGSDFPTANYTLQIVQEGLTEEAYQYTRVDTNLWSILGFGYQSTDTSYLQTYNPAGHIPLPVSMGSSWTFEIGWSDTVFGFPYNFVSRSQVMVDAYGSMTVPMGTSEVLRTVSYDTVITTFGVPPVEFSDTTTWIEYSWVGQDPTYVATVESMEGETNPNFTTAAWISRAANPTGIGGDSGGEVPIPRAFRLDQNVPNPFNPRTDIKYALSEGSGGSVELAVYNVRGEKVRTLVSGQMSPGEYTVSWDGRDDRGESLPSGVYLYRLTSGGKSLTRKMMMAK